MTITVNIEGQKPLTFPDGTDPAVIQGTVKKIVSGQMDFQGMQRSALNREQLRQQIELDPISAGARAVSQETRFPRFIGGNPDASEAQRVASSLPISFSTGAAAPILGGAQLVSNAVTDSANAFASGLGGSGIQRLPLDSQLQEYEQMRQAGGVGGSGVANFAGNVMSPVSLAAMKIAPAATAIGRTGQGAAIGTGAGLLTPVTNGGENYWTDKGKQGFTGFGIGGGVAGGMELARGGAKLVEKILEPTYQRGRENILNRYLQQLARDNRQQIVDALRNGQELVPGSRPTASQVLADIPESTALASHERALSGNTLVSGQFNARTAEQQAARRGLIEAGAGTDDLLNAALKNRAENAAERYGPIMQRQVNPMSDEQIMANAIAQKEAARNAALRGQGMMATDAAQAASLAEGRRIPLRGDLPATVSHPAIPGQTEHAPFNVGVGGGTAGRPLAKGLDSGDYTQFPILARERPDVGNLLNRVPEALSAADDFAATAAQRAKERSFLEGTLESLRNTVGIGKGSLDDFTSRPSFQDALAKAELSAREAGRPFPTKPTDKFTVQDMQAVKEFLDENIRAKIGPATGLSQADRTVRDMASTRDQFIKWLGEKVPEWKTARVGYAEDSIPINQMQTMQELGKRLTDPSGKETATKFLNAIDDRTPEAAAKLLKKTTGFSRYENLGSAIGPKNEQAVRSVEADLVRELRAQRNSGATNFPGANKISESNVPQLPRMLSTPATIANWVMRKIDEGADDKLVKMAAERYLNPKQLADALETTHIKSPRIDMMVKQLRKGATGVTIGAATAGAKGVQ